ncbi:hypothetical protein PG985_005278 [Apiospora marii]|uniref:uncharacterized protein n=1 Tax=Apiospora marii TaxID=335849 RepID=UPI00312DACE3
MAPITLETLHRAEATIKSVKARVINKEHQYRVNIESQLKAHESEGTAPSAELTAKANEALKEIQGLEEHVRHLAAALNDQRAQFYYAEHMTDRIKFEETKHEEDEKDGLFLAGTKRACQAQRIWLRRHHQLQQGVDPICRHRQSQQGGEHDCELVVSSGQIGPRQDHLAPCQPGGRVHHSLPPADGPPPREAPQDTSHAMGLLTTCLHRIQEDAPLLGGSILAILEGKMGRGTFADLEASLKSTFSAVDLRAVHGTHAGSPVDQVLSTLGGEDSDARKTMLLQLLQSTLVLNKYACLATALATAIAPKLGRGKDNQRRQAITLRALQRCLNYHRKLHRSFVDHTSGYPQLAHALTDTFGYNKGGAVGATLANDTIKGCLEKLGKHPDINCDLVKFLGSVGYGLD